MKIYIAGPMTGYPEHNYPAFHQAATMLTSLGHDVESPAAGGHVEGWEWPDYMRRGLHQLLTCDTIALLPGWQNSRGATIEHQLATDLGMTVIELDGATT